MSAAKKPIKKTAAQGAAVASFTVTIPDAILPGTLEAVCAIYGYDAESGVKPEQFVQDHLHQHLCDVYQSYQVNQAIDAMRAAVSAKALAEFG